MLKNGTEIEVNGRTYRIEQALAIGPATAKESPTLTGIYAVRGTRGALAMMHVFASGRFSLLFMSGLRTETGILA